MAVQRLNRCHIYSFSRDTVTVASPYCLHRMTQWPLKFWYYGIQWLIAGVILCTSRSSASLYSHRHSLFILSSAIVEQVLNIFGESFQGTLVDVIGKFWC